MTDERIHEHATRLLRRTRTRGMPLRRLYRALAAEFGPLTGGESGLARRLRERPTRYLILEAPPGAPAPELWPELPPEPSTESTDGGAEPDDVIGPPAALAPEPRVLLLDSGCGPAADHAPAGGSAPADSPVRVADRVREALAALASGSEADPVLIAELHEAVRQMAELRRRLARSEPRAAAVSVHGTAAATGGRSPRGRETARRSPNQRRKRAAHHSSSASCAS